MAVSRIVSRPLLASMFVVGGLNALQNSERLAARAKPVIDRLRESGVPIPDDALMVKINGATHIAAGAALATSSAPRIASLVLAGSLVPTTIAGHRYWEETDPVQRSNQRMHFFKNLSMLGGLLISAADTEGRPGVAWRAKRAARDAKDQAVALLPG